MNGRGVLYLEYLPAETLHDYLVEHKTLPEGAALKVLEQLVDAVGYMHSKGISHHDIKPDNVSYDPDTYAVKIFDFGLAIKVDLDQPFTGWDAGSPLYMAPEVLLKDTHNPFYADVWSLGILFYETLFGRTPFSDCKTVDELGKVWTAPKQILMPKEHSSCSPYVQILFQKMLAFNPEERITISEIKSLFFPNPMTPILRKGILRSLRRGRIFSLNQVAPKKRETGEKKTSRLRSMSAQADSVVKSLSKRILAA